MKKILIIDNTFDPPHGCPEIQARLREAAEVVGPIQIEYARAPESKIPKNLKAYDGVVLSGSKTRINESAPWIDLEMEAIRELHREKIPTFGICYGEQLIAKTLAGEKYVGPTKVFEHGWSEMDQLPGKPFLLFEGLPKKFHSFQHHHDEVSSLPPGFTTYARSADCAIQAFDVQDAPMWCVQFHPERELAEGNRVLDKKLSENPNYRALNRDKAEKVYNPNLGKTMFVNFLRYIFENK